MIGQISSGVGRGRVSINSRAGVEGEYPILQLQTLRLRDEGGFGDPGYKTCRPQRQRAHDVW